VQPNVLLPQRRPRPQHAVREPGDERIIRHQLVDPRLELAATDLADLETERLDRMPNRVLDVEKLALEIAPFERRRF
jgi:hypothetical protein